MSQRKAEKELNTYGSDCYLTRYSKGTGEYVLSVLRVSALNERSIICHFKLVQNDDSCEISGTNKRFPSITELLEFYIDRPINDEVSGIGDSIGCRSSSLIDNCKFKH